MKERTNSEKPLATLPHHASYPPVHPNPSVLHESYQAASASWNMGLEPWPEVVDAGLLLNELAGVFARFVVVPKWAAEVLALWTVHTYAFNLREVTPYLAIESSRKRCGKSRLLIVLSALVNRAVLPADVTSSGLLRVIEETRPTLLIDEADTLTPDSHALRSILNSGYNRSSAFVPRLTNWLVRDGSLNGATSGPPLSPNGAGTIPFFSPGLALFSSWCPKAIATRGRLADTILDHCIVIRMRPKTSKDHCDHLRNLERYAIRLMRKSARFVCDHSHAIANAHPGLPVALEGLPAETWSPLVAIADQAGDPWPLIARQAALALASNASVK